MEKICSKCKSRKASTGFSRNPDSPDGLRSYCKTCQRKMTASWKITTKYQRPGFTGPHICATCGIEKLLAEYSHPREYNCRACSNENLKAWKKRNPEKVRAQHYRNRYGIDMDDYNKMLANQSAKCGICGLPQAEQIKKLEVDHCHETKKIRGLLCQNCNKVLGLVADNIQVLYRAASYLEGLRVS